MPTVLIVEDRPLDRKYLTTLLRSEGFDVREAPDGADALDVLRTRPIDLVISDVLMPTLDGFELVRRIRELPGLRTLPVMFYTATYHEREARELAQACGVEQMLVKPSPPDVILRAVNTALGRGGTPQSPVDTDRFSREHVQVVNAKLLSRVADLEAHEQRLTAIAEVAEQIAAERNPQKILRRVCDEARRVTLAQHVVLGLLGEDHTTVQLIVTSGVREKQAPPVRTIAGTLLLEVVRHRRAVRRLNPGGEPAAIQLPPNQPATYSFLAAPLASPSAVVGWIGLSNKLGADGFSQADEQVIGALATHAAIAYENARLLEDLRSRTEALEQQIAETARAAARHKLVEEQFRQAQKMEAIGQLAGGVAHDFNNLLTAILGYANLLADALEPGQNRADVEEIARAAERAAELTRQLLAFSRKQVLQPVAVDLNTLVTAPIEMLRRLIGEQIELVTVLSPEPAVVVADPTQIEQILMNLAVNARDAMPEGGRLVIETARVMLDESYAVAHGPVRPGPYVMLAVTDNGIGMDEATRQRVFEPFFTTKEQGRGTGLGLATVYGIVKQSGGYVWVYSEPGRGTTFKVYLPAAEIGAAASIRQAPAAAAHRPGSETVLVVEDERAVRLLTRVILERAGYRVLEAENPQTAEELFAANRDAIDLLITDVIMPGATGRQLFERLAAAKPGLKALFMSGYTRDALTSDDRLDPGLTFLEKPFTADLLTQRVREALDR